MKKLACFIIIFGMLLMPNIIAFADNIEGIVVSTDIAAFVNLQPIRSYNINNYTYVVAEDLRDYGFDVIWDEHDRTLKITCNYSMAKPVMSIDEINVKKTDMIVGEKVYDVYSTDIKTYVGDDLANAYNVNGKTLLMIDELQKYGYFDWDKGLRKISIDVITANLDWIFEHAEDKVEITLSDTQTYIGQVSNGLPHGIGKITETYTRNEVSRFRAETTYFGFYEVGKKSGMIIEQKHILDCYYPYRATSTFEYNYTRYGQYDNDKHSGYFVTIGENGRQAAISEYTREEGYYTADGKLNGFGRKWKVNRQGSYEWMYNNIIWEQGEYINDEIQGQV